MKDLVVTESVSVTTFRSLIMSVALIVPLTGASGGTLPNGRYLIRLTGTQQCLTVGAGQAHGHPYAEIFNENCTHGADIWNLNDGHITPDRDHTLCLRPRDGTLNDTYAYLMPCTTALAHWGRSGDSIVSPAADALLCASDRVHLIQPRTHGDHTGCPPADHHWTLIPTHP